MKKRFKIPLNIVLHCRTLFSGQQREKIGLAHLTPGDVRAIAAQAITIVNEVNGRVHYAVQDFAAFRKSRRSELQMYEQDGTPSVKLPVTLDPKGVLGMMAFACFPIGSNNANGPSAAQCEIFISEEKTKVAFIGEKRSRADALYTGYFELSDTWGQLNANIVPANAEPLLQLADIAAYVCSHASSTTGDIQFWKEQCARISNWFKVG